MTTAALPGTLTSTPLRKPKAQPAPGGTPSGKNTLGLVVASTAAAGAAAAVKLTQISAPAPEEQEKSWLESGMDYAKQVASDNKGTLNSVADAIGQFGDSAGQVGGDVVMAGGATAGAGGLVALTGVGAPVGGAMVAVGAAGGVVGGVVAGVGGLANVAATGIRSAVTALTGGTVNATAVAAGLAEKIVLRKAERVLDPILNKIGGKGGNQGGSGGQPQGSSSSGGGNKGPAGAYAVREGRCTLRPYQPNRCPPGQTGHHVVPDHCFTQPGGARYANVPSNAKGLVICVGGAGKHTNQDGSSAGSLKKLIKKALRQMKGSTLQEKAEAALAVKHGYISNLAEHGRIHFKFDAQEQAAGLIGKPPGTMELGKMEAMAAKVVAEETGCDAKDLEKQLREHHKSEPYKLGENALVRADPFGQVKGLDMSQMGRPDQIVLPRRGE